MSKNERNTAILSDLKLGYTLQEVGDKHGLTRERVRQILRKVEPELDRKSFGISKRKEERTTQRKNYIKHKYNRDTWHPASELEARQSRFFTTKRNNVLNSKNWEFLIEMSDLDWPTHCPVLGIELDWFATNRAENSPSIDRIDSTKGYVKGNVVIMSWRANRIKNDGTAEEHRKIAEFLEKV